MTPNRSVHHPEGMKRSEIVRMAVCLVALSVATLTGCGTDEKPRAKEPAPSIIGTWKRDATCGDRVKALTDAGMGKFAIESAAGDGLIPGVTDADQVKDPSHPCRGAKPVEHSHFFTDEGQFGSLDDTGQQVDDGSYRLVGKDSVVISKVTFHYTVTGDTLTLDPVLPECAKSGCFDAQWAVAVSYNGLPWQRVPGS
jgi:hypothetical protein